MPFPFSRYRRLRQSEAIRRLVRENILTTNDLIAPLFVTEGKNITEPIASIPGYHRYSLDILPTEVKELWHLGIRAVLLFAKVDSALKDNEGKEALHENGLMQRAIKTIKDALPDLCIMTDVAFDPYSVYGHDGIIVDNEIENDKTIDLLARMALSHARAGADFLAPSDMMDGRVRAIRELLEQHHFHKVGIMAYSVKYASCLYAPFRSALDSAPAFGDKKTYQMDYANAREAVKEALADIEEGADIIMIKPGLPYLDIIKEVSKQVLVPVAAYHVSGEYAMLKAAAEKGWLDYDAALLEMLMAFKRAGADIIATYSAKEAARLLQQL